MLDKSCQAILQAQGGYIRSIRFILMCDKTKEQSSLVEL